MRRTTQTYLVQQPLEVVVDYLSDLTKFATLHPLIISARLKNVQEKHPSYRIRERPFGFIPISIGYFATVIQGDEIIKYEITGLPLNKPQFVYYLTEVEAEKTEVLLDLTILGLPGIENILMAMMTGAQDEIMLKLNQV